MPMNGLEKFSYLEDKIYRTIEQFKRERQERDAAARPRGRFLLLSLELCSLAFLRNKLDKKLLVAGSLFGDGCAAALVEGDAVADAHN